jgi:SAM-dependent methyltransferase
LKELCKAVSERQLLRGDWKDQIVYDLGCGDGKVNIQLAKEFGTRGVGLDLDGHLISQANALAESEEVNHLVSFKVEDILKTDLSDATVLFLYLLPDALEKLKPILELALAQPGVILIVEQWPLVNWDDRIVYNHNQNAFRVYSLPEKRQDWNTQSQAP